MAALLVALAIMSVIMMTALPAWRFQAKREKEAELAWRGEQWARAIGLYQRKNGTFPPSLDILVQQRYIRKKYKDPFAEDGEFLARYAGVQPAPGTPPPPGVNNPQRGNTGRSSFQTPPTFSGNPGIPGGQGQPGGIIGVMSKSKEASIRIYKGATRYNEWNFTMASNQPGVGPGGQRGMPGGRGTDRPGMPGGPTGGGRGFPGRGGTGMPGGRGIVPGPGGRGPGQ